MISIVGSGRVGTSIGFLCVSNGLDDVLLVNRDKRKAIGEALDVASSIPAHSKFTVALILSAVWILTAKIERL